jgi:uncharacterized metal-binding protein YceD (DUF177 family)
MIIEFRKIPQVKTEFELKSDEAILRGTFTKINSRLVDIQAQLKGSTTVVCNRCTKEFSIDIDQEVELKVSDGIYNEDDNELDELIYETFDSKIDFNEILNSEIEAIRSDYHNCSDCKSDEYEEEF